MSSGSRRWWWSAVAVSHVLAASALAHAAEPTSPNGEETTVAATAAPPRTPSARAEDFPRLDERTAFTVGERRLKVGVLSLEYGITERFSVGSAPVVWALRAFRSVLVPNLTFKYQLVARDPIWVAAVVSPYFANLSKGDASGQLLDVPVSLFASFRLHDRFYLHAEGAYVFVRGFGNGDLTRADIGGTAATSALQTQLMAELRLAPWFALTALGRVGVWTDTLTMSGSGSVDAFTTASVDAELEPRVQNPWEVVGGFALLFKHFHLIAGAGYGYYFVPGMYLPNTRRTFVPDGSISVLFTL